MHRKTCHRDKRHAVHAEQGRALAAVIALSAGAPKKENNMLLELMAARLQVFASPQTSFSALLDDLASLGRRDAGRMAVKPFTVEDPLAPIYPVRIQKGEMT
jgi:hypothetical protein